MLSALKNSDFCTNFDHIVSKSGSIFHVSKTLDLVPNYWKDWNDGKSVAAVQENCLVTK